MPVPDKDIRPATERTETCQSSVWDEIIQADIERVSRRISEVLQSADSQIQQCLSYLTQQTGKMLRPALVLLSGQCIDSINPSHFDLAAMIEIVHQASLLHDDVMDSARIRRGQATANFLWGNTAAVLLGDFLLSRAFYLGSRVQCPAAMEVLCLASQQLCSGELLQNLSKENWDISESQYYRIIEAKTAALFQSSCQLGAIASDAVPEQVKALGQFGNELGIAFQIADDLVDILGTSRQAGKTLGTDLKQGKLTLPLIYWIQSDPDKKEQRINFLDQLTDLQFLIKELHESGSVDYALKQVTRHIACAKQNLKVLKESPGRSALLSLADYILASLK